MPDKSTQDWQADEQFWSEAWADMEQRLDRAETQPKRRAGWWWLAGGLMLFGALLAVVVLGVFGEATESLPTPDPTPETSIDAPGIAAGEAVETDTDLTATEAVVGNKSTTKDLPSLSPRPFASNQLGKGTEVVIRTNKVAQNQSSSASSKNDGESSQLNAASNSNSSLDGSVIGPQSMVGQSVAEKRKGHPAVMVLARRPSSPLLISKLEAPDLKVVAANTINELKGEISACVVLPRYRFFAETEVSHGNQRPGIGYGISAGVQRGLTPRSGLSASLGYLVLRERLRSSTDGSSSDEFSVPVPGTDTMPGTQELTALAVDELVASGNNYLNTEYLRFGLDFGHRLGNRWAISGGVGINFLLAARGPVVDFSQPSGNRGNNFVDLLNPISSSFSAATGANNGDLDQLFTDLQRFRYDFRVGADYALNRHLSVGLGARYLATSLLEGRVNTDRFRTNVRLRYSF